MCLIRDKFTYQLLEQSSLRSKGLFFGLFYYFLDYFCDCFVRVCFLYFAMIFRTVLYWIVLHGTVLYRHEENTCFFSEKISIYEEKNIQICYVQMLAMLIFFAPCERQKKLCFFVPGILSEGSSD